MNNLFANIGRIINSGRNPQVLLNNAMQNPQLNQYMNNVRNQCQQSGLSEKDFVIQQLKNNGMSDNDIRRLASMYGLRY